MIEITRKQVSGIFGGYKNAAKAMGIKENTFFTVLPPNGPISDKYCQRVVGAAILSGNASALPQEVLDLIGDAR